MRWSPLAALFLLVPSIATAQPLARDQVPEPLRPWIPWVLHDAPPEAFCAALHRSSVRRCAWPGKLTLVLDSQGGRFSQSWRIDREAVVTLPGDPKRWPLDVRVDGAPAVVFDAGEPKLRLTAGDHLVSGVFSWEALPESLRVGTETGIIDLSVRGTHVAQPTRDAEGLVYLSRTASAQEEENLDVAVQRKVTDEVPLLLTTRILLEVSGKNREVLLGRALSADFVPLALESQLPARLEPNGRLRLQVRPGTWTLTLTARRMTPLATLQRPPPEGPWAEGEEIWVFEPRPHLRLTTVEGVAAIDPQQTRLPDDWKRLAAYPLKVGDTLTLVEQRRGDADPAPDQLALQRQLWLDFDGGGYTVSDTLTGKLGRSVRLSMGSGTQLGRVEIAGRDQFITRLPDGLPGVEVRDVNVQLAADSRIPGARGDIPAVGWAHDFQSVSATLHLPPGWKLLHAMGADDVPQTWWRSWTLLDFFLLIMTGLALGRLFGPLWGALALVTLVLTAQETDAPRGLWLALLAGEALVRALPEGKLRALFRLYRLGAAVVLVFFAIVFLAQDIRTGLYPALEKPYQQVTSNFFGGQLSPPRGEPATQPVAAPEAPLEELAQDGEDQQELAGSSDVAAYAKRKAGYPSKAFPAQSRAQANRLVAQDLDRSVSVQTGPGLPQWSWEDVSIRWSGPVEAGQRLRLFYISPRVNLVLAFLRLLLVTALVLRLLPFGRDLWPRWLGGAPRAAGVFFALALGVALAPGTARAEGALPPKELLDTLRERLLKAPLCGEQCASAGRMALSATPGSLTIRLELHAGAHVAAPLPGRAEQWSPDTVTVDGKPAPGLYRSTDGLLWLPLQPGAHQVTLQGALPRFEAVQLALPLTPHRVEAKLDGWTLAGIHEDGVADADLELTRVRAADRGADAPFQSSSLPPFVEVQRTLSLGLDWEVSTEVRRMSPLGSAIVLEVPLLPGESPTADVRVAGGKAMVNLGAQTGSLTWRSTLPRTELLVLTAPKEVSWVEVWRLDVSPLWHVELSGIPPIHRGDAAEVLPELRPWPGESVKVSVQRPEGLAGQTLTVDQTRLRLNPGLRATDGQLFLSVRSSRGGQHTVSLPEGAQLQSVAINGAGQPIRQDGRKVTLPIAPGPQTVQLAWREPRGVQALFRNSRVDVGVPSVNAHTELGLSRERWVLFAGGPRLGPSVLFWSLLLVMLGVSLGLSRTQLAPLRIHDWVLLSLGLSQVDLVWAAVVAGWFLFLGWRQRSLAFGRGLFNLRQVLIVVWTGVAVVTLFAAIREGLLGWPDMQIAGNGSSASELRWFEDRTGPDLSSVWILSVPVLVYRLAMLGWALWLARSLLKWLRWAWTSFNEGGLWRGPVPMARPAPPAPPAPPSTPT